MNFSGRVESPITPFESNRIANSNCRVEYNRVGFFRAEENRTWKIVGSNRFALEFSRVGENRNWIFSVWRKSQMVIVGSRKSHWIFRVEGNRKWRKSGRNYHMRFFVDPSKSQCDSLRPESVHSLFYSTRTFSVTIWFDPKFSNPILFDREIAMCDLLRPDKFHLRFLRP